MKKIILFIIAAVIVAASCKPKLIVYPRSYPVTDSSLNKLSGNFVLTKFTNLNSNKDSTAAFIGYVFSFGSDGKITAIKNNQPTTGSYTETHTLDDNLELAFFFTSNPLNYLNGNWWVKSISNTSIELGDASTGDVLEFDR